MERGWGLFWGLEKKKRGNDEVPRRSSKAQKGCGEKRHIGHRLAGVPTVTSTEFVSGGEFGNVSRKSKRFHVVSNEEETYSPKTGAQGASQALEMHCREASRGVCAIEKAGGVPTF